MYGKARPMESLTKYGSAARGTRYGVGMYENGIAPTWTVNGQTRVYDPETNRTVATLQGHMILPVGSEIELYDPDTNSHGTATVIKIRLLNGTPSTPNQICLDVEVDDRWWDAHPHRE